MTISTIMVNMKLGSQNDALLTAANSLADRLSAGVLGVAACQPMSLIYSDGYVASEALNEDQRQIEVEMARAEEVFRARLCGHSRYSDWRCASGYMSVSDFVSDQARAADMIITSPDGADNYLPLDRRLALNDLIMRAGRPILVIPDSLQSFELNSAMICWKDTREARRAIADALPILKLAKSISIVELCEEEEMPKASYHVEDVARWLSFHGLAAQAHAYVSQGKEAAQLLSLAKAHDADLLVAGAYGHSRFREWMMGGVTKDLLQDLETPILVSH